MKVILKQDVKGVGRKFEVREVAEGYANNFLIPKKLAEFATKEAVKRAEILREKTLAEMKIREELTRKQIEMLKEVKVVIKKKANEKGHLFEQIHIPEIIEALKSQAKVEIPEDFIVLEKSIKEVGEHLIPIKTDNFVGEFKIIIEAL
jgi:large subunit ribosomal protein L9